MSTEMSEQHKQYESLPILDVDKFPSQTFLSWRSENLHNRHAFFEGVRSVEEALELLLKNFPNLKIVRGSGLANPLGTKGDFFVGNLDSALIYTLHDTQQAKRDLPIIVTANLGEIMQLLRGGKVTIHHHDGDVLRFRTMGVINILPSETLQNELYPYFKINRPPKTPIDRSKFANFVPSLHKRISRFIKRK